MKELEKSEKRIAKELASKRAKLSWQRFNEFGEALSRISKIRNEAWDKITKETIWRTKVLAGKEVEFMKKVLKEGLPFRVSFATPSIPKIKAAVASRPYGGRVMRKWFRKLEEEDGLRIKEIVKKGVIEGYSVGKIANEIRITQGMLERHAEAVTRTAVMHASSYARRKLFEANKDIVKEEQFIATLDDRTTIICGSLDNQVFPVGKGPKPPLHYNCRSLLAPLINPDIVTKRPMKRARMKDLIEKFADANDIDLDKTGGRIPRRYRKNFTSFKKAFLKYDVSIVESTRRFSPFLKMQQWETMVEVLGQARARLFKIAGMKLQDFVDLKANRVIPLRVLHEKHAAAFKKAGITSSGRIRRKR